MSLADEAFLFHGAYFAAENALYLERTSDELGTQTDECRSGHCKEHYAARRKHNPSAGKQRAVPSVQSALRAREHACAALTVASLCVFSVHLRLKIQLEASVFKHAFRTALTKSHLSKLQRTARFHPESAQ
eukprot:6209518-Pleurochrysis_carterae.AAC.1